jgi:hypothetical protein
MGESILERVISVASGETRTRAELEAQEDFIPWKRDVSLGWPVKKSDLKGRSFEPRLKAYRADNLYNTQACEASFKSKDFAGPRSLPSHKSRT